MFDNNLEGAGVSGGGHDFYANGEERVANKHWKLGMAFNCMARFDLSHNSTNASTNVNSLTKICSFLFVSCTSFFTYLNE